MQEAHRTRIVCLILVSLPLGIWGCSREDSAATPPNEELEVYQEVSSDLAPPEALDAGWEGMAARDRSETRDAEDTEGLVKAVAWEETLASSGAPGVSEVYSPRHLSPVDAVPLSEAVGPTAAPEDSMESPFQAAEPLASQVLPGQVVEASAAEEPAMRPNPLRPGSGIPAIRSEVPAVTEPAEEPAEVAQQPAPATGKGKGSGDFDPIRENGPVFVGWPTPKLALLISGQLKGYVEPCGCAGLDRMKGGLSRRYALFEDLRAKGWPVVGLDVGGLTKHGIGPQAMFKLEMTIDAMKKMGYDAIGFGKTDLNFLAMELVRLTADMPDQPSPFISANAALLGFDFGLTHPAKVIEAGGMKVGVTSIVGSEWQKEVNNSEVEMVDPAEKLAQVVPALAECDVKVLLSHATMDETIELAQAFNVFDVVVTAGGMPMPPLQPERIDADTLLIEVGEKGMDVVVLGFYDDPATPVRYQRVPLDSRYATSPEVVRLMENYQSKLKLAGLDGLGLKPVAHPAKATNGGFVGSKECADCHEDAYDVWRKSGHAHAWSTLVELSPPRNYDPECISCHVVGWHPTEYFPYEGGFLTEAETPHLVNVGCESCHGPGQAHIEAEMGSDYDLQEKLQQAMVVTLEESRKRQCVSCHDLDNSPDFDFDTYWPKVEHYLE